jgi:hypothetical protein
MQDLLLVWHWLLLVVVIQFKINVISILLVNFVFGQVLHAEMQHVMMQVILVASMKIQNVQHIKQ